MRTKLTLAALVAAALALPASSQAATHTSTAHVSRIAALSSRSERDGDHDRYYAERTSHDRHDDLRDDSPDTRSTAERQPFEPPADRGGRLGQRRK